MSRAHDTSPEAMAVYRATAERREARERQALVERRERAWQVARRGAALLRAQFGATRVLVSGSLVHELWLSETSDIDLAAWGLSMDDYFLAVARLQGLSPDFKVNLVDAERCRPAMRKAIAMEGTPL